MTSEPAVRDIPTGRFKNFNFFQTAGQSREYVWMEVNISPHVVIRLSLQTGQLSTRHATDYTGLRYTSKINQRPLHGGACCIDAGIRVPLKTIVRGGQDAVTERDRRLSLRTGAFCGTIL